MNPALAPPPLLPLNRFPPTSNKSALDPLIHYSLKTKGRAKRKKKTSEAVHRRAHLHFIMAPTKLDSSNLVTKTKGRIYDITDNKIHAGGICHLESVARQPADSFCAELRSELGNVCQNSRVHPHPSCLSR